jgi:hypothetical protein
MKSGCWLNHFALSILNAQDIARFIRDTTFTVMRRFVTLVLTPDSFSDSPLTLSRASLSMNRLTPSVKTNSRAQTGNHGISEFLWQSASHALTTAPISISSLF